MPRTRSLLQTVQSLAQMTEQPAISWGAARHKNYETVVTFVTFVIFPASHKNYETFATFVTFVVFPASHKNYETFATFVTVETFPVSHQNYETFL
jgi:hypothetical protein